jgi:ribonuclease D
MEYVQTEDRLNALVESMRGAPIVAADTEAAGYHRYFDRVCLVQLSTRQRTYVVDSIALKDLSTLGAIFADPATEIVLHDAEYDVRLLDRDYGIRVSNLFDTKIAAQMLGEPAIGLAGLVEKYLSVKLDKKHQRADWAQRPLSDEMLEYAAEDTVHLPALRDSLRTELVRLGRLEWAEEEFKLRELLQWTAPNGDDEAYLRLKNTRDLKPRELAALREVHGWREDVARERDVAPFRVLSNEALIAMSKKMPATPTALSAIPGISGALASRRGNELLAALRRARELPADQLPVRPRPPRRPPPDPEFDKLVDRLKGARDKAADDLGLDRGVLMPRQQLEAVARSGARTLDQLREVPDMKRWQVEALGDRLVAVLTA